MIDLELLPTLYRICVLLESAFLVCACLCVPPFPKCSIILPQSFSPSSSPKQQRCTSYCLLSSLSIHHFKYLLSSDSPFCFTCSTPLVSCHVSVFPNECLENYRRESKFFCFSSGYESTFPEPCPTFRHPLGGFQFVCSREDIIPYVRFQRYRLAPSLFDPCR